MRTRARAELRFWRCTKTNHAPHACVWMRVGKGVQTVVWFQQMTGRFFEPATSLGKIVRGNYSISGPEGGGSAQHPARPAARSPEPAAAPTPAGTGLPTSEACSDPPRRLIGNMQITQALESKAPLTLEFRANRKMPTIMQLLKWSDKIAEYECGPRANPPYREAVPEHRYPSPKTS